VLIDRLGVDEIPPVEPVFVLDQQPHGRPTVRLLFAGPVQQFRGQGRALRHMSSLLRCLRGQRQRSPVPVLAVHDAPVTGRCRLLLPVVVCAVSVTALTVGWGCARPAARVHASGPSSRSPTSTTCPAQRSTATSPAATGLSAKSCTPATQTPSSASCLVRLAAGIHRSRGGSFYVRLLALGKVVAQVHDLRAGASQRRSQLPGVLASVSQVPGCSGCGVLRYRCTLVGVGPVLVMPQR